MSSAHERRLHFDTEFIEDGRTIDLLSIGVVRDDGRTYYAELAGVDRGRANPWVQENVLPHITGPFTPRERVARDLIDFAGEKPQWWAYYADYDWVALCQLYGTMMDLPDGWPMYCRDVKQYADEHAPGVDLHGLGVPEPERPHHALDDAVWTQAVHLRLEGKGKGPLTVDLNPCYAGWGGCEESYTGGHACDLKGGHPGRHRCACGARVQRGGDA